MSSSVVSAASCFSWRSKRATSSSTFAPPSSRSCRSRLSRSRRRSSWSLGIVTIGKESQELRDVGANLRPREHGVKVAVPQVGLGEAEVLGELLAGGLLHDARAREREQ